MRAPLWNVAMAPKISIAPKLGSGSLSHVPPSSSPSTEPSPSTSALIVRGEAAGLADTDRAFRFPERAGPTLDELASAPEAGVSAIVQSRRDKRDLVSFDAAEPLSEDRGFPHPWQSRSLP